MSYRMVMTNKYVVRTFILLIWLQMANFLTSFCFSKIHDFKSGFSALEVKYIIF